MRLATARKGQTCLLAACLLWPWACLGSERVPEQRVAQATSGAPGSDPAPGEYRRKLEAYRQARQQFEATAAAYWASVAEKRRLRASKRAANQEILPSDYVLTQPPVYGGPAKPVDHSAPPEPEPSPHYIPVVADFLQAAREQFNFVPSRPRSEIEFKQAYARVAASSGLTKKQIVRIYAFEAGGTGGYDVQAGLEGKGGRAISTAVGYNQLLVANTVELLAEEGDSFVAALRARAAASKPAERAAVETKIGVLKRMIEFTRSVPREWSEHEKLAKTPKGWAVHALTLDADLGPLLQAQNLVTSVVYANRNGFKGTLTAAELELMNLTGDATGLDMILMPAELRSQVPTSNFFRNDGYDRNPIAKRHNVVSKLLAAINGAMDAREKARGSKDLADAFPEQ